MRTHLAQNVRLPIWVWFLVTLAFFWGLWSPNAELSAAAMLVFVGFIFLLWRPAEPPILFFAIGMQWLQAVTEVFYANFSGVSLFESRYGNFQIGSAVWLCLLGLSSLAVGMRLGMLGMKGATIEQIRQESFEMNLRKVWMAYLVSFLMYPILRNLAWLRPELTQIIIQFAGIKWALLFLVAYSVLVKRRGYHYLALMICLEVVIGMTDFFGGFKDALFVVVVAFLTVGHRFQMRTVIGLIATIALLFYLSLLWTIVKMEYREYLNQGTRQQVVLVSFQERLQKMGELLVKVEDDQYQSGMEALIDRIAEVDLFGYVLEHVPSQIPHEDGQLWSRAFQHIFMPRLLFPDKPPLPSDSVVTNYYTGLNFAGEEEGTSVGLGYMAETFIDFGVFGLAWVPLTLGFLWGHMYRFFIERSHYKLFGYALSVTCLMNAYKLEIDNVFLLGSMTMGFLALAIVLIWAEKPIHRLLTDRR